MIATIMDKIFDINFSFHVEVWCLFVSIRLEILITVEALVSWHVYFAKIPASPQTLNIVF